jgi:alpha-1,3-rhamnosyl/mannosyltransferase
LPLLYLRVWEDNTGPADEIGLPVAQIQERFRWLWSALFLKRHLDKHPVALFHSTNPINIPRSRHFRTIATVYDLIPTLYYDEYLKGKPNTRASYLCGISRLKHVDHLIAISQQTKADCVRLLKIPEEKISVIPLGIDQTVFTRVTDPRRLADVRSRCGLPDRFFLYVGGMDPRKNLAQLVDAYAAIAPTIRDSLVLVGPWSSADTAQLTAIAERSRIGHRLHILSNVPVDDLVTLYSMATSLLFPSLYEGFGLPVVEAYSCRTAVLCSKTSSLAEIGEGAALLVDPESREEISRGIRALSTDENLRRTLEASGFARSGEYSVTTMAERTLNLYESVLQGAKPGSDCS